METISFSDRGITNIMEFSPHFLRW